MLYQNTEITESYSGPDDIQVPEWRFLYIRDGASFSPPPNITSAPGLLGDWGPGTVVFDRNTPLDFYGTISGGGAVEKYGAAEVHLRGKLDLTGPPGAYQEIEVHEGTLYLDHEFSIPNLSVTGGNLVITANNPSSVRQVRIYGGGMVHLSSQNSPNGILLNAGWGMIGNGSLTGIGKVTNGGNFSAENTGIISPGTSAAVFSNGIGTLSFENIGGTSISLKSGSKYIVGLDGASTKADLLSSLGGNIVIESGALLEIDTIANPDKVQVGDVFTIVEIAENATGSILGEFDATSFTINGIEFDVVKLNENGVPVSNTSPGKKLVLRSIVPVPEPSTYALFGGLGALAVALWRKRRRRAA